MSIKGTQNNGSSNFDKVFPLKFFACKVFSITLTRSNTNGNHGDAQKVLKLSKEKMFELYTFVIFINRGQSWHCD